MLEIESIYTDKYRKEQMNKHTVDLKRAKQMTELGWEKETLFRWLKHKDHNDDVATFLINESEDPEDFNEQRGDEILNLYPAPISSEILEELTDKRLKRSLYEIKVSFYKSGSFSNFICQTIYDSHDDKTFKADTAANALSDLWIYLKKEKLI